MVSYKTYIILKLMTLWNTFNDIYTQSITKTSYIYNYILDFYYGNNNIWMFINKHLTPISLNNIRNNSNIDIDWIYDTHTNELKINRNNDILKSNIDTYKMSWLSSKIRIISNNNTETHNDYEIDSFIENIQIKTNTDNPPTLSLLFMCWCIYTKYWFSLTNNIEFHIITNMGDEEVINLTKHNNCLQIKNKEIISFVPKNEETSIKLN